MPHTLRRMLVSALFMCVFATIGSQPVVASVDHGYAKARVVSHQTKKKVTVCDKAAKVRRAVVKKLGKRAPGRDICRYGLRGGKKPHYERRLRYLHTLKRLKNPPPVAVVSSAPPVQTQSSASASSPASAGGAYCGLFQFDQGTWESVGGSGSPCSASSTEQWNRARLLQQQRGNQPWPVCGANGASLEQIMNCESSGNPTAVG